MFVPDENKEQIAKKMLNRADRLAKQYKKLGGDLSDLGRNVGLPEGLPSAEENKGRIVRDTETGKRYRSDGVEWREIQ